MGLDLKVCGTIQFFSPTPKRDRESNYFFLDQTRRFFQHNDGNDNGMFSLLGLLEDSPRVFTQTLLAVGGPENQRVSVGNVIHLSPEIRRSKDLSRSFLISVSARLIFPVSVILPRNLSGDCFAARR